MIDRDGFRFIAAGAFVTLVLLGAAIVLSAVIPAVLAAVCALLTVFVTCFFRDPERAVPSDSAAVISPADGRIVAVETVAIDDFPGGQAVRVAVFMSAFNVHVNRAPLSGRIDSVQFIRGRFGLAWKRDASCRNQRNEIHMTASNGDPINVRQISGAIARRVVCRKEPGSEVAAGERIGIIRFGSRVEVDVPAGAEVQVGVGQTVRAGETILARLGSTAAAQSSERKEGSDSHA